MSMEYRMRRTLPDDRVAIIMPVDHGLIFSRLPGTRVARQSHRILGQAGCDWVHDESWSGQADRRALRREPLTIAANPPA
jgi:hypothetical protein